MHFQDFWLLPVSGESLARKHSGFKLVGKTERRGSRGFRTGLASGGTRRLENCSCCCLPSAWACWEAFRPALHCPAAILVVTAEDYKSTWRQLKQTGVKSVVNVEAIQVPINRHEHNVVRPYKGVIIPSYKRRKFSYRLQHG